MGRNTDLGWAWKQADKIWKEGHGATVSDRPEWMSRKEWKRRKRRFKKRNKKPKLDLLRAPGEIFYNSKPWLKMRIKVLAAYGRKCMKCDRVDGAMHIDHIKPRSKFPELSLTFDNLQVLCPDCNIEKWNYHATDYRDEAAGRELDLQTISELRNWL